MCVGVGVVVGRLLWPVYGTHMASTYAIVLIAIGSHAPIFNNDVIHMQRAGCDRVCHNIGVCVCVR